MLCFTVTNLYLRTSDYRRDVVQTDVIITGFGYISDCKKLSLPTSSMHTGAPLILNLGVIWRSGVITPPFLPGMNAGTLLMVCWVGLRASLSVELFSALL